MGCFQGKLKDLLLGGMVLPVPQDGGLPFTVDPTVWKDGLLAVEFLLDFE